jgi:hypothetical protein
MQCFMVSPYIRPCYHALHFGAKLEPTEVGVQSCRLVIGYNWLCLVAAKPQVTRTVRRLRPSGYVNAAPLNVSRIAALSASRKAHNLIEALRQPGR